MSNCSPRPFSRRALLGAALAALPFPRVVMAAPAPAPVVTMLGDSITAGLGLPSSQALPVQLQAALARRGVRARVRGAGVSGDTSAAGLARLDFSVQPDTRVCVVALGGNDLLRGLPPAGLKTNLTRIVRRLKARRIGVVLCGLTVPASLNAAYARRFNAVFAEVAKTERVTLHLDLLAGVGGVAALNQDDGLHPNARGVRIIAERLAPVVAGALRARG